MITVSRYCRSSKALHRSVTSAPAVCEWLGTKKEMHYLLIVQILWCHGDCEELKVARFRRLTPTSSDSSKNIVCISDFNIQRKHFLLSQVVFLCAIIISHVNYPHLKL